MKMTYKNITKKDWEELLQSNLRNKDVDDEELKIIEKLLTKLKKDRSFLENKFTEFYDANLKNVNIVNDFFVEFNMKVGRFSYETKVIAKDVQLSKIGQTFYYKKAFELCLDFFEVWRNFQNKTMKTQYKLTQE